MADRILRDGATGIESVELVVESAGAGDAGKGVGLDESGKLSESVMPVGIGVDNETIVAGENLSAGDYVNIYDDAGTRKVRKANATDDTKPAHGYVKDAVVNGGNAVVYQEGSNDSFSGLAVGARYYLSTTSGAQTTIAPSTAGNIKQFLGIAASSTAVRFEQREYIKMI